MTFIPGLTPPVYGQRPPSMLTRPGANTPKPIEPRSDVASTGGGYGSATFYPDYMQYVNALPGVMNARMSAGTGGAISDAQTRQALQQLITNFGDPTVYDKSARSLSSLLGPAVDPATAALARANTVGKGGAIGNSIVAQLHLAMQKSLQNAIDKGTPLGFTGTGQTAYGINQANIAGGQHLYDAGQALQEATSGAVNQNANTHFQLNQGVSNAITSGVNKVMSNPSRYPVAAPYTAKVGGNIGLPKPPKPPAYPKPGSFSAAPTFSNQGGPQ